MGNKLQIQAQAQIAVVREIFYLFFSSIFLNPPQDNLIKQLQEPGLLEELSQYFDPSVLAILEEFSQGYNSDLDKLQQEYYDLFHVPLGKYVTPYESVYCDTWEIAGKKKKGLLLGPSAQAVRKIYRRAGTELDEHCTELPDHAGIELAFMHYLCQREREAWQQGKEEEAVQWQKLEAEFVINHLTPWLPELCKQICQKTQSDFYRGIAQLINEFILSEQKTFTPH